MLFQKVKFCLKIFKHCCLENCSEQKGSSVLVNAVYLMMHIFQDKHNFE